MPIGPKMGQMSINGAFSQKKSHNFVIFCPNHLKSGMVIGGHIALQTTRLHLIWTKDGEKN